MLASNLLGGTRHMSHDVRRTFRLQPHSSAQMQLGQGLPFSELDKSTLRDVAKRGGAGRQAFFAWWEQADIMPQDRYGAPRAVIICTRTRPRRFGTLLDRLRGMVRNIGLGNHLRMRALPVVLDALQTCGGAVLLKGAASSALMSSTGDARPVGDMDLLIDPERLPEVIGAMRRAGFHSSGITLEDLKQLDLDPMHMMPLERERFEVFDLHWRPIRDTVVNRRAKLTPDRRALLTPRGARR